VLPVLPACWVGWVIAEGLLSLNARYYDNLQVKRQREPL
jgi:hypothetical protein